MATPGLKLTCLSVTIASLLSAGNALANPQHSTHQPTIQMAILLDTSNSMDGLIDQARQQLWQAVDEFAAARRDGVAPRLEVAVYEYGNSNLNLQNGYTRRVLDFTPELDQVSEALFSLTTDGGAEYCGYAINAATNGLQWSTADGDIKAIFIAGNEPFSQGPIAMPMRSPRQASAVSRSTRSSPATTTAAFARAGNRAPYWPMDTT